LNFGKKLAVFVHSFHRLGSFVEPKAWEHKSPKPLERKTLLCGRLAGVHTFWGFRWRFC
jgi:hypothetical protein